MNVDHILQTFNKNGAAYLLIGGIGFLLRHKPQMTFDVDFWIEDSDENRTACEKALIRLKAEWGSSDRSWGPVAAKNHGWLKAQSVFCLTSPWGAIDIFLSVKGLESWVVCNARAVGGSTAGGVPYRTICDRDMLRSQLALQKKDQHPERIAVLRQALRKRSRK